MKRIVLFQNEDKEYDLVNMVIDGWVSEKYAAP